MNNDEALYELGRYQRKVEAQSVEIHGLEEAVKGYEQLCEICTTYIALLLQRQGAVSPETAAAINREDVIRSMGKYQVVNGSDDIANTFKLYVREAGTDGREGEETDATEQG